MRLTVVFYPILRLKIVNLSTTVIAGLALALSGCQDGAYITPPPQSIGATLNSTFADRHPRFSDDGRYLVFTSDRLAQRSIFLYDAQAGRLVPLPGLNQPGLFVDEPDLSADGRYLVYIAEQFGKPDVFVYDRLSNQTQAITRNFLGEVRHPTISGNGRFIAFETNRSGQWDIMIFDRGANIDLSLPQTQAPLPAPSTTK